MDEQTEAKIRDSRKAYATAADERFLSHYDTLAEFSESPIELIFGAALIVALHRDIPEFEFSFAYGGELPKEGGFWVSSQEEIGRYRLDFYVRCERGKSRKPLQIAIECDGHDFHERTKEQARRDRARDRALQLQGIVALRFTGSEIWADADACAAQVVKVISDRVFFDFG
jgi:very-short-patch-repair endonuclease